MKARHVAIMATILAGAAGATLLAHSIPRHHTATGPVAHVKNGFEFTVQAPYNTVVPLFGASGERAWGGEHWNPKFLYPSPERDQQGAVFTVAHGHLHATWVNTVFDVESGHIQYVYVIPEAQAVVIDLHVRSIDASTTGVKVVYERTALDPSLNDHITELGRHDRESGPEWAREITKAIASKS